MRVMPMLSHSTWRAMLGSDVQAPIRLGTRRSVLALAQAEMVAARLLRRVDIVPIAVEADSDERPLSDLAGTRVFTSNIERRLLEGEIDLAVHSLKDLSVTPVAGLRVAARLPRGRVGDLLLKRGPEASESLGLNVGARVGTASPRRSALLGVYAPQASAIPIRGNVPTRIRNCLEGRIDAVILAQAGIDRLGAAIDTLLAEVSCTSLNPVQWLPAPGQAAIAVQARDDDQELLDVLATIDDCSTGIAVDLERRLLRSAGVGCGASLGVYARLVDDGTWRADVGLLDGQTRWRTQHAVGDLRAIEQRLADWISRVSPERRGS